MGWKDGLRPASFRGVPFKVPGHEASYGRRGPLNEYPERDLPFFDDMGRRARQYQIEAYVLGDDYMAQRDALIGACEQKGPGTLVHFYLGSKTVVCIEAHLQESVDEGRMARFRLLFVEAGEAAYPSAQLDTRATVAASCSSPASATMTVRSGSSALPHTGAMSARGPWRSRGNSTSRSRGISMPPSPPRSRRSSARSSGDSGTDLRSWASRATSRGSPPLVKDRSTPTPSWSLPGRPPR